jgi:hypothetical protein
MTKKEGKTLRNILCAGAFTVLSLLPGCQKEVLPEGYEKNPPHIKILSPLEGQSFKNDRVFPITWEIEDESELGETYISVNGSPKFLIYSKTGSLNWSTNDFANKVVIDAKDIYGNESKDSTTSYNWDNPLK